MESIKNLFSSLSGSEVGQFSLALFIVLNSIWLISWLISTIKYFYPESTRLLRRTKGKSKFKVILYCRHDANPWRDSPNKIVDCVMLIYNSIIGVLFVTFLVANILFQN